MRLGLAAILLLYVLTYLVPLGARPLVARDEVRYGEIAREMIETGDWVVPRVAGLRYFEKPPLAHWAHALSILAFGENAFALRLPSALAAGITAWLVFLLARRGAGGASAGLLGAAAYLGFSLVFVVSTACLVDGLLCLFVAGTLVAFRLAEGERGRRRLLLLALCGACAGAGVLTKGLVTLALIGAAVAPYLLWQRRPLDLLRMAVVPAVAAAAVVLPWALLIHDREPDFWRYVLVDEHLKRFASSDTGKHNLHLRPWWFYAPVLLAGTAFWSFAAASAVAGLRRLGARAGAIPRWRQHGPHVLLYVTGGELAKYVLPCFPALAVLFAAGLTASARDGTLRGVRWGAGIVALLLATAAVGLIGALVLGEGARLWPEEEGRAPFAAAALLLAAAAAIAAARADAPRRQLAWFAAIPVALFAVGPYVLPTRLAKDSMPGPVLESVADRVDGDTILVSDYRLTHAVCWFFKRSDPYLLKTTGEFGYGLSYPQDAHRRLKVPDLRDMIEREAGNRRILLVLRERGSERYRSRLPPPSWEHTDRNIWVAEYGP